MAFYSYVAFVTSKKGEETLTKKAKTLEGDVLEAVQYLLEAPTRSASCGNDTLRIWGPVTWYDENDEVEFFKAFVLDNPADTYLVVITPDDFITHEDNFGSYLDNPFRLRTNTSFFYYEDGKPKSTALMLYEE